MTYPTHLLPTTVVGSYPQPDWLVNRAALEKHGVPRTHAQDIWRIPVELLELAQDDGTILAIRDMERAGIDIITDGEIRRDIPVRSARRLAARRRCRAWSARSVVARR
jgi:5-methyltetrahydropteroyltriglutamate--homocysteine methyltransferase